MSQVFTSSVRGRCQACKPDGDVCRRPTAKKGRLFLDRETRLGDLVGWVEVYLCDRHGGVK